MEQVPYIGITDFTNADQAEIMRAILDDEGCKHLLHVGVMMSYKTLHGLESKWAGIFPPKESLQDIFVEREGVMNVLHYADYDNQSGTDDWIEALHWAGPAVDAIQFDMPWPDADDLFWFRRDLDLKKRPMKFIIQVGRRAIHAKGGSPNNVADALSEYRRMGCIDYALFDMSGGKGVPLNAQYLLDYIWVSLNAVPDLGIATAGGLGPSTMNLAGLIVRDLSREHIPISFDAQSELRPSRNAEDPVDWGMGAEYLREAAALLRNSQPVSA